MKVTLQDQKSDQKIKFESYGFGGSVRISIWEQDLLMAQAVINDKQVVKLFDKLDKHIRGA